MAQWPRYPSPEARQFVRTLPRIERPGVTGAAAVNLDASGGLATASGTAPTLPVAITASTGAATAGGGTVTFAEVLVASTGLATGTGGTVVLSVTLAASSGAATAGGGTATVSIVSAVTVTATNGLATAGGGTLTVVEVLTATGGLATASGNAAAFAVTLTAVAPGTNYSAVVLADSPTAYYRMNSGTATEDDVIGTNDGTYVSTPPAAGGLISGDPDGAHAFVSGDIADEMTMPGPTFTTDCAIEFWFSGWTGAAGSSGGVLMRDNTNLGGWIPFFDNGTTFGLSVRAGGQNRDSFINASRARDGGRHHVVMNLSGSNVSLWLDGVQLVAPAAKGASAMAMPWHVARNGNSAPAAGVYATGTVTVDEIAFYPAALSSGRIAAHYAAGITGAASTGGTVTLAVALSATGGVATAGGGTANLAIGQLVLSATNGVATTGGSVSLTAVYLASGGVATADGGTVSVSAPPQIARPDGDLTTTWTVAPLYPKISDSSDATVITGVLS